MPLPKRIKPNLKPLSNLPIFCNEACAVKVTIAPAGKGMSVSMAEIIANFSFENNDEWQTAKALRQRRHKDSLQQIPF
jgi:hypothetical protein